MVLMPLGEMRGISPGSEIIPTGSPFEVVVGDDLLGRVIDGLGNPLDDKGPIRGQSTYPVHQFPSHPYSRQRIHEILVTGVRAIDGLLTCGQGQRIGIFSGSGVGKSTLLGMIGRYTEADVNVIALVGERGREVRDFIEKDLGEAGLKRSVVVAATSDQPPLVRVQGAFVATAIAEYFRDQGKKVILMMDSVTRLAMAQREIGLAIGEPPATKGYTPSVFSMLPRLLERAGTTSHQGNITGIYTVLVEADDINEPISDAVRAILDGHIVLSRELASQNHYPPIDILESISRLMNDLVPKYHKNIAGQIREYLAVYKNARDLINIGAYVSGSNPKIDAALHYVNTIESFLKQAVEEKSSFQETIDGMGKLFVSAPSDQKQPAL